MEQVLRWDWQPDARQQIAFAGKKRYEMTGLTRCDAGFKLS